MGQGMKHLLYALNEVSSYLRPPITPKTTICYLFKAFLGLCVGIDTHDGFRDPSHG